MELATAVGWQAACDEVASELKGSGPEQCPSLEKLEELRLRFLGREQGRLTGLLKSLKNLSIDEKRSLGPRANQLKAELEERIARRRSELEAAQDNAASSAGGLDLTLPARLPARGRLHPLTLVMQEMASVLTRMGFSWAEGPHAETEYYNFEALNIPEHHSARDMHDTFYLQDLPLLLRTHTSPGQIRSMESARPPLRIICPGRVFRHDAVDATHSAVFHQVEGLAVDKNVTFADLKGTLESFMQNLLGPKTRIRFRPSYFPFTEPSTEVDVKCFFCSGAGCGVCKRSGWIELLGAGLVHPNVFKAVDYDPEAWSGFAFGIGVERLAMLRLGVSDIRMFYENDERFLRQFDENIV
jgi:phenylalanyl-tRNA synthetase alpha chain